MFEQCSQNKAVDQSCIKGLILPHQKGLLTASKGHNVHQRGRVSIERSMANLLSVCMNSVSIYCNDFLSFLFAFRVKRMVQEYEYDGEMESAYRNSLFKSFIKTLDEGFFPLVIVDAVHEKVRIIRSIGVTNILFSLAVII